MKGANVTKDKDDDREPVEPDLQGIRELVDSVKAPAWRKRKQLTEARETLGLSLSELAPVVGADVSLLEEIEAGAKAPRGRLRKRLEFLIDEAST